MIQNKRIFNQEREIKLNFLAFVAITKVFRLPIGFEFKNIISLF